MDDKLDGWMSGWVDKWTGGWFDKWMIGWVDELMGDGGSYVDAWMGG